jgi:Methyltransferase domain
MLNWTGDDTFSIGDTEYVCRPVFRRFRSTAQRFCLLKARWAVDKYERLLDERSPQNIVEVGVYDGASTALFAEVARPRKLVAIDIADPRSTALDEWVRSRGLEGQVVAEFGIDQADAARLADVIDREFTSERLDLVVDDASHALEPTRRTFNCLFPRLAVDGLYVIEDWWMALGPLAVELIMVAAMQPDVIAEVTVHRGWVIVRRGTADLDKTSFDISSVLGPHARAVIEALERQSAEGIRSLIQQQRAPQ